MTDPETIEHLAADTGLRPEEIDPRHRRPSRRENAQHLAADTQLPEEEFVDPPDVTSVIATSGPSD